MASNAFLVTVMLALSAPAATAQAPVSAKIARSERLAVSWDDAASGTGRVRLLATHAPWPFAGPALETGANARLRHTPGRLWVVSRTAGTLTEIDLAAWTVVRVIDVGASSEPVDVAFWEGRAYLTRTGATELLRVDLATGGTSEVIDLGIFADSDGVPDLGDMAVHEGRLFVQLLRVDHGSPLQLAPHPFLAVVDLASETLVDVDPATPGDQAIVLAGTFPKLGMQLVRETRRLYVGATGAFFDGGGIEEVDLDALASLGLVVSERNGQVGADLGAFVFVSPTRGFLAFSTDFALSSHLSTFTLSGEVQPVPDFYAAVGYFAPALAYAPGARRVFFPEAGWVPPGLEVFDASTGERVSSTQIPLGGAPTDLLIVAWPFREASEQPGG